MQLIIIGGGAIGGGRRLEKLKIIVFLLHQLSFSYIFNKTDRLFNIYTQGPSKQQR